jgi:putative lipoprotein
MFESSFRVSALLLAVAASLSGSSEPDFVSAQATLLDQDPTPPTAQPAQKAPAPAPHPISRSPLRMILPRRAYLCADGAKVVILFETSAARLTLNDRIYNMKLVQSASTTKYAEGSVVWSSTGEDGFLADNTDPANPKMLAEKCHMTSSFPFVAPATNAITGTVSYRQHVSLPPDAVIVIHLQDVYIQDAPSPFLAEFKTTVGQQNVPIPFTLKYDPAKIDPNHPYVVEASILVHEHLRFTNDTSYPVLTKGHPAKVDIILVPVQAPAASKP